MASFGVGDTIAVIQICIKLAKLVQECRGAPESYKVCVTTLEDLHATFSLLSHMLEMDGPDAPKGAGDEGLVALKKLEADITSSKRALQRCAAILEQRYASLSSPKPKISWAKLRRRVQWSETQKRYDEQLDIILRAMHSINVIVGLRSMSFMTRTEKSLASIRHELNTRPPAIGLPGTGGRREDHICFEDGLGTSTYLPSDLCTTPEKLESFLPYRYARLPGESRVHRGHFRLYCTSFNHPQLLMPDNWSYLAAPGSKILLAFVIGTWQMSCLNWCPSCNTSNRGPWNAWRQCSCGTRYFVTEAHAVNYEPVDGHWYGETPKSLEDWEEEGASSEPLTFGPELSSRMNTPPGDGPPQDMQVSNSTASDKTFEEQLYFRSMVLVYDPIFNWVCRNVLCRCILGVTSMSSHAPRIDVLTSVPCPRHAPDGVRLSAHVLDLNEETHVADSYFDQYGGRSKFLRTARYINELTIARAFVDVDKLFTASGGQELTEPDIDCNIWKQYRLEVLNKIELIWSQVHRQSCETIDEGFMAVVDEWFGVERKYLSQALPQPDEEAKSFLVSLNDREPIMVATLSNGRCTIEDFERIVRSSEFTLV